MHFPRTAVLALIASLMPAVAAHAGISFTGTPATENFNGMPSSGTATSLTPTVGTVNPVTGCTFDVTKVSGTGTTLNLVVDNGTGNSGAAYSYGATGDSDRALGVLASGSSILAMGVIITNNSGAVVTDPYIGFYSEAWRSSTTTQNVLTFAWGTPGPASNADYLTNANLTANSAFNIVGPTPVATNGAIDGNANTAFITGQLLGVTLNPGDVLYLRWTDTNDVGNDAGLAIDNFTFSTSPISPIPEPASLSALAIGGVALLVRRRK